MTLRFTQRRVINLLWLLMIAGLTFILLVRLSDGSGMIGEAVQKSIDLSPDGQLSLGWTYVWLAARYFTEFAFTAIFFFTATVLFFHESDSWMATYLAVVFVALGIGQVTGGSHYLVEPRLDYLIYRIADVFSVFSAVFLFLVMPNGRFVPGWTRIASIVWGFITLIWTIFPTSPFNPLYAASYRQTLLLSQIVFLTPILFGIFMQVNRWNQATSLEEKQQVKWMLVGMLFMVAAGTVVNLGQGRTFSSPVLQQILVEVIGVFLSIGFPVCLSIAVTRHRLWELNSFISQALVWTVMTSIGIGIFVLVVGGVGGLINAPGNPVLSAAATALVAIIFQPARQRVQRFIDRYLFGLRDDPIAVISSIGERHQSGHAPDRILDEIVITIAQLLKLPYVSVELLEGETSKNAAVYGKAVPDQTRMALVHQQVTIGSLVVGSRAPGEVFNAADMHLLEMISWQVAALGHILRLNRDLQHSRERLVQVAERERQRLQRDLHDGLGTELTAQMLKIGTARAQVYQQPQRADELLGDVEQKLVQSVGEVRRLIHNLRPPVLDQLGLRRALELLVDEHRQRDFDIRLIAPIELLRLPPAVEIAAYRIVQEAVSNVVKHAHATTCEINLLQDDALQVTVSDDGVGLPADCLAGVGLASMRERAEELGGNFRLQSLSPQGTRLSATLPINRAVSLNGV